MTDNKNTVIQPNESAPKTPASGLTMKYVLEQIKAIQDNDAYLHSAVQELGQIVSVPGDMGAGHKAEALGNVVSAREETNRRLIDFYAMVYDDLRSENAL